MNRRATRRAGCSPTVAKRASSSGTAGGTVSGDSSASLSANPASTVGPTRVRHAAPSTPRPATVSSSDRCSNAAGAPSTRCANGTSGCTNRSPWAPRGSGRNAGDATPNGCTAEQTSCTTPGSSSSAERNPPPGSPAASTSSTSRPARASVTAQTSPFGPDPTTTTSGVGTRRLPQPVNCGVTDTAAPAVDVVVEVVVGGTWAPSARANPANRSEPRPLARS